MPLMMIYIYIGYIMSVVKLIHVYWISEVDITPNKVDIGRFLVHGVSENHVACELGSSGGGIT